MTYSHDSRIINNEIKKIEISFDLYLQIETKANFNFLVMKSKKNNLVRDFFAIILRIVKALFLALWSLIVWVCKNPKQAFISLVLICATTYAGIKLSGGSVKKLEKKLDVDFDLSFDLNIFDDFSSNIKRDDIMFGIDVSHYQGKINWANVGSKHPVEFAIVRSTMGTRRDKRYSENISGVRSKGLIAGTYHYYDPNQNSTQQAKNFIARASVESGDLVPVLDIEKLPVTQSLKNLKKGLRNYSNLIKKEYGVRPIIYTGLSFWEKNLEREFSDHYVWIAAYSGSRRAEVRRKAIIHQFSEGVSISGIASNKVDGNDISRSQLHKILMP